MNHATEHRQTHGTGNGKPHVTGHGQKHGTGHGSKHSSKHGHHGTTKHAHKNLHHKDLHKHEGDSEVNTDHDHGEKSSPEVKQSGICEFDFTTSKLSNLSLKNDITKNTARNSHETTSKGEFRWAAEFMAGPGGFLEKAEIVSPWFETLADAKSDARAKAETEILDYPFSHGVMLRLIVEDKSGHITELENVKRPRSLTFPR